jgi:hypothetical protein
MKQEYKVMFKGLSRLDGTQKAYVQAMYAEILASKLGESQSGNGNENVSFAWQL